MAPRSFDVIGSKVGELELTSFSVKLASGAAVRAGSINGQWYLGTYLFQICPDVGRPPGVSGAGGRAFCVQNLQKENGVLLSF